MTSDDGSYERLIRPVENQMIRSVWRILRDPDDADDAFQDALTTIWKRLGRIRRHPNPQALILRICVDAAYDVLRRRFRRVRREASETVLNHSADPTPSAAEQLSRSEQRTEILSAIAKLSRKQARAILMRVVHEQPYEHIAQALGCSEATARTHASRARARLCELLPDLTPNTNSEAQS